jgi:LPS-assembly protein
LKNILAFEPSVGFRETIWYVDDWNNFGEEENKSFNRNLMDVRLDLSTELANTYSVNYETTDRIKHTLRPQVVYDFLTAANQDDIPKFDEIDQIDKRSVVTYSVTNTFSMRYKLPERKSSQEKVSDEILPASTAQLHGYRPFGRFKVQQSYDFNETVDDRPFSPIIAKLDLALGNAITMEADAAWSTYDSEFLTHNIALRASGKSGNSIFIEHRYTRDRNESLYSDAILRLDERVSLFAEYERDMKNNDTILYGAGVLYMASCWSVDFGISKEEDDLKYAMSVNLYGLGGIGKEYVGRKVVNPFEFD